MGEVGAPGLEQVGLSSNLHRAFSAAYGIERIELRAGRSILIGNVGELLTGEEVQCDDLQVRLIVGVQPKVDGFCRETSIGEGDDERRAKLEDARHFHERLDRACEVLY